MRIGYERGSSGMRVRVYQQGVLEGVRVTDKRVRRDEWWLGGNLEKASKVKIVSQVKIVFK